MKNYRINKHYRSDGDENNSKYSRTVELQRCIGIRRNELKNIRGSDLKEDESDYLCVVVRRGKGGKETYQRILPEDIGTVNSFFDGTENKVFSAQEMNNSIDYHHMRAEQAVRAYNYYLGRINNEPGYRRNTSFYNENIFIICLRGVGENRHHLFFFEKVLDK